MTTLAENSNRDIFLGPDGNLVTVTGIDQCALVCKTVCETVLDECVLELQTGLPYGQTMWTRYLPRQFEAAARAALLGVLNVVSVVSFNIVKSGDTASWTAVISTSFGKNVAVSGVIPNV